ncbi:putative winged helix-turn-helix domain containing protein 16 [Homarus americanus]|uniref:Putative winged helix-turn-helix domain containing protein 16 n=1 Tax=Homarus americanus TaxID=6706 RepID=A0A8J5MP31_HOMAM|nr:putative winged helix-turn-helix domain containing protein 16 [Homarus americanus]
MDRREAKVALRGRIVGMRDGGFTNTDIARELGIDRKTLYRWLKRWSEEENLVDRLRSGAPRKTTPAQDQIIHQAKDQIPFTNAVVKQDIQLNVTPRTVDCKR